MYWETRHSQDSLSKHFQVYLGMFRDIDAYSPALSGMQILGRGGLPVFVFFFFFFESRKKVLFSFWEKGSDGFHLCVKLSIQNVVLRVSKRKNLQNVSLRGLFFLVFLTKRLSKCPSSPKPPLPWKISGCAPALRHYSFCKSPHFNPFSNNVPLTDKPGSKFLLAKCLKNTCGRVSFQVKM